MKSMYVHVSNMPGQTSRYRRLTLSYSESPTTQRVRVLTVRPHPHPVCAPPEDHLPIWPPPLAGVRGQYGSLPDFL